MIEIKELYKNFGKLEVLKGVSLTIEKHDAVAIIGPSGGGKSTLLRCINMLEVPSSGKVLVDGVDMTAKDTNIMRMRQKCGMVFQDFNLFPNMTVRGNLIYAPMKTKNESMNSCVDRAKELLDKVGLLSKLDEYPRKLSGGQKQRVAIARALMMEPEYMLFDEPTSALDPEMIKEVLNVIRDLAKSGMTMAIVTHEMNFCRDVSNKVCFLDHGVIMENSATGEFYSNPKTDRAKEFLSKVM
ncbi:MAG: amino acid ABC transporter ATP-binding protein [Bacillota bacterium]|nr:amino acid ABC transporter ATP-binding protein [Bacillota bacterium]